MSYFPSLQTNENPPKNVYSPMSCSLSVNPARAANGKGNNPCKSTSNDEQQSTKNKVKHERNLFKSETKNEISCKKMQNQNFIQDEKLIQVIYFLLLLVSCM